MAAVAWRNHCKYIHAYPPFIHSCTAGASFQEDLLRADERQEPRARAAGGQPKGPPPKKIRDPSGLVGQRPKKDQRQICFFDIFWGCF
jgi:hypothetical protein